MCKTVETIAFIDATCNTDYFVFTIICGREYRKNGYLWVNIKRYKIHWYHF